MPKPLAEDDLRLAACSLCGLDCLGESHAKTKAAQLPEEYRGWIKEGRRIIVGGLIIDKKTGELKPGLKMRPRCERCVREGFNRACADSDQAPYEQAAPKSFRLLARGRTGREMRDD